VAGGDSSDELVPPALESLYYEILRGLGAIKVEDNVGSIDPEVVRHRLQDGAIEQGWHWVRAWLSMRLWQDGIGLVPDRDRSHDPERIEPGELHTARELLSWALSRVAQTSTGQTIPGTRTSSRPGASPKSPRTVPAAWHTGSTARAPGRPTRCLARWPTSG
jgi:hypothetical protein